MDVTYIIYIVDINFKNLLFRRFGNVVAIRGKSEDIIRTNYYFILDNPFVKAICDVWLSGKCSTAEIWNLLYEIRKIASKGYATLEDIENRAMDDPTLKDTYELIKRWMKQSDLS